MPNFLERTLRIAAISKGLKGPEADKYVYGALNNMSAMHGNVETPKGHAMDAKHAAKMETQRQADVTASAGSRGAQRPLARLAGNHPGRNLGKHLRPKGR